MTEHTDTRYRGEFRKRGSRRWYPFHGSVRLREDDGSVTKPEKIAASVENMREAIGQWDAVGRYEWRIIGRATTWREWVVDGDSGS